MSSLQEVGLEAQWQHYCFLRDELGVQPMVIEAEAVAADPSAVIGRVWSYAGLAYVEAAFEWNVEVLDDWQYVEGWHQDVVSSTGIRKDETDPDEAFAAVAEASHLKDFLAHHQPFYDKLKDAAQA